ncbi:MAG TPA: TolC family protein, partial [Verrucomicrobiae bacterium]
MKRIRQLALPALAVALVVTGCRGIPVAGEKQARRDVAGIAAQLQTNSPALTTNSTLSDAVLFAVKNHPQVIAAFADWAGAVENITVARSRPDPKLTFELYAADIVSSLMPGIMTDIPGPGKLPARGAEATAESRAKYFQFASAVQQTAFGVEKSYYP